MSKRNIKGTVTELLIDFINSLRTILLHLINYASSKRKTTCKPWNRRQQKVVKNSAYITRTIDKHCI